MQVCLEGAEAIKKRRQGPFERLGLSERTCHAVKKVGFLLPTPIQRKAIPAIIGNTGDVIAMARTGSGKTMAFLLPLIDRLDRHSQIVGVRGLILLPTRELAIQTSNVCKKILYGTDLRLCMLVGGSSMPDQFAQLANNPDILIATPGRLTHHIVEADFSLTRVEIVVFDEADQLWALNLEDDMSKILKNLKLASKQCILMSATIPKRLAEFANIKFTNPIFIQLDTDKHLSEKLTMDFYYCRQNDKVAALLFWLTHVLEYGARVLIFCATRHHTNFLVEFLRSQKIACAVISGAMSIAQRSESMEDFVKKKCSILLATDVAARGVDIDKLDYVFHYDFPPSAKLFVHRSGRTARKDQCGTTVSLLTREDMPFVVELMLFTGRRFRIARQEPARCDTLMTDKSGLVEVLEKAEDSDDLEIGGFPNLDHERLVVEEHLKEDVELARLHRSVVSSHQEYLRYRIPASRMSVRRAGELLNSMGGPEKLPDVVHSKLQKLATSIAAISKRHCPQNKTFSDVLAVPIPQPQAEVGIDTLQEFRPARSQASSRGMGVNIDTTHKMKSILQTRQSVSALAIQGLSSVSEHKLYDLPCDTKASTDNGLQPSQTRLSRADRRQLKRGRDIKEICNLKLEMAKKRKADLASREYMLEALNDETSRKIAEELKLNIKTQLGSNTFDILGDDAETMRKGKLTKRWDPVKKKYVFCELDKEGKRIKTKDGSGHVVRGELVKRGLYKKWQQRSGRRIQRTGEDEDGGNVDKRKNEDEPVNNSADHEPVEPTPLENLTTDLGLLERVKNGHALTHKQKRKYTQLLHRAATPVTRSGNCSQYRNKMHLKGTKKKGSRKGTRK